jgi:hypothetical protein
LSFSKSTYEPEVAVVINHPLYSEPFVFYFPKRMPQEAVDASSRYLGLPETERDEERDKAFVLMLTSQMSRAPEGFEDLQVEGQPLASALADYFYDPDKPELLNLLLEAKRVYKEVTSPRGYLKSSENSHAGNGQLAGATQETSAAV